MMARLVLLYNIMNKSKPKAKKNRKSKSSPALVRQYLRFFSPVPSLGRQDDDNFYFDQPSPLKWVPSETTYGIGTQ